MGRDFASLAPEGAALVERVRAIVPQLAKDASEAERLRRPTDASIAALRETGVFELMVPRAYGGLELDLDTFVEVGLTLAEADVSIAWVTTFYIEHNWMLCQFPESFQRALFADRSHVLAPAAIAPAGRADEVDGGFQLSGRWQWGTGAMHGEWAMVGGFGEAGDPASLRFFALPMRDVRVDDTWFVDGMQGTGSNDLVVEDRFVPHERTASLPAMVMAQAEGGRIHGGPLYRTPMVPILLLAASLPIVGRARHAVAGFRDRLTEHHRFGAPTAQAQKPALQIRLANAAIEATQAEETLRTVVREVCALRDEAQLLDRARWAASVAHAVHQSRRVLQEIASASGASAHFDRDPLQRSVRDVNVASCHVAFDLDGQRELYGRLLLGLEPAGGLF